MIGWASMISKPQWRWCRTAYLLLIVATLLAADHPVYAIGQLASSVRAIRVLASPGVLALDPTTNDVYVRSRGHLDRYGDTVGGAGISELDGHTGQVMHVWPDAQGLPTISFLDFMRTSNGLQAYHYPSTLLVAVHTIWGIISDFVVDSRTGRIFEPAPGPTADSTDFVVIDPHRRQAIRKTTLPGEAIVDMVADSRSSRVAVAATPDNAGDIQMTVLHVFDAQTGRLQASVRLRGAEVAMAVDGPASSLLIFLNAANLQANDGQYSALRIFTLDSLHPVATIALQGYLTPPTGRSDLDQPWDSEPVAVDTSLGRAVVIDQDPTDPTALVVDVRSGHVLHTVDVGAQPIAAQTDMLLHRAYVVNNQSGDVTVIDLRTGRQVADVQVGAGPSSLAVDAHTGEVFVANSLGSTVTMFPANIGQ